MDTLFENLSLGLLEDREVNRNLISQYGNYIEIFVNTTVEECEKRDPKGLYALARESVIKDFTGISSPFEEPENPEIIIESGLPIKDCIDLIFDYLKDKNLL